MDKIPAQIKEIIAVYLSELERQNFPLQKVYLFGSQVHGTSHKWSDIDIALVSDAFKGNRFQDKQMIRPITLKVSSDLSPLPFRPEEFNAENPLVNEILKNGMELVMGEL